MIVALAIVLDFTNEEQIEGERPTLVKFFAPWCEHCKTLAPVFVELADRVEDRFVMAEINCVLADSCFAFGVKSYPTLVFYNYGEEISRYNGPRTVDAIEAWLNDELCVV